jgi:hypothetical protein
MNCRCTPAELIEHGGHVPGCLYHRPGAAAAGPPNEPADAERKPYRSPAISRELGPAAREGLVRERTWLLEQATAYRTMLAEGFDLGGEDVSTWLRRLHFYLELETSVARAHESPVAEAAAATPTEPSGALENPKTDPPPPPDPQFGTLLTPNLHGGTPYTTGSPPPRPPAMQELAPGSLAGMRASQGPVMPTPAPPPRGFERPPPRPASVGPEYSSGCAHATARLQAYAGGSMCQDCGTIFPHYRVPA